MADSLWLKSLDDSELSDKKWLELWIHKTQVAIHFLTVVTNEDVGGGEYGKY